MANPNDEILDALFGGGPARNSATFGAPREHTFAEQVQIAQMVQSKRTEQSTFTPGQVVRHKWFAHTGMEGEASAIVFEEYLPEFDRGRPNYEYAHGVRDLGTHEAARVSDCRVLLCNAEGNIAPFLLDSRDLEPHPDYPLEAPAVFTSTRPGL